MATTFLEPGGDATFNVATTTNGGFWQTLVGGSQTVVTDFVHGNHVKSIKYPAGSANSQFSPSSILSDSGSRISFYAYFKVLPTAECTILALENSGGALKVLLRITPGGVLKLADAVATQIGTNGSTLSTGRWYRISLAYTITSTSVNRFEQFVNGVSSISITNATLTSTGTNLFQIGSIASDTTLDWRSSDHYADNSSSLLDTGDIWVTAKRPNANGTANGFTTQIGAGGSGYGSGHSPQVNERALSTTNGWSMVGAGSAVTEEYNIEQLATGDININGARIVDYVGWVYTSSLVGETINIILGGVNFGQAITSTNTMYTKVAGSTAYPVGGTDIGIQTDTSLTTVSLYECGVMVAYIPAHNVFGNYPPYIQVGNGQSRNEQAT